MIQIKNLRKSYGSIIAVDDVSFDVKQGETFGLLGPNGAGKTTAIHIMAGALRPDAGEVFLNGEMDPSRPQVRRRLGIAPQRLSLYEQLTGEENIRFFGKLYGLRGSALAERVQWALDFVGLADRKKDRMSAYSGGMQRRLNLACAMVHDPPIILLDEPTVGVDPQSRNSIFDNIEALSKQGRTILYTTHYMEEAQRLCDRVAIMDHGKILDLNTVDGLIEAHGGKAVVLAELDKPPESPDALGGVLNGTSLRIECEEPFAEVARLGASAVAVSKLRIERPDLETVFLNLTGRRLRD